VTASSTSGKPFAKPHDSSLTLVNAAGVSQHPNKNCSASVLDDTAGNPKTAAMLSASDLNMKVNKKG